MLEEIFDKYSFKPLGVFVDSIKSEIIEEETQIERMEFSSSWIQINSTLKNGLELKILINTADERDWITFYFNAGSINFEKVEFVFMKQKEYEFDGVVRNDYFLADGEVAITFNSAYRFDGNKYVNGYELIRKVKFESISHYAGRDNLANFSCHIDSGKAEVLYSENRDVYEEKPITSIMASSNKETYKNVLMKLKKD